MTGNEPRRRSTTNRTPGSAPNIARAKSTGEERHQRHGNGTMTQLKLPRSKNRKVKEHSEKDRKGKTSKKQ